MSALKAECARVSAKGQQIETEAAPIRYVAAVFSVTGSETAVRGLILVLTCEGHCAHGDGFGETVIPSLVRGRIRMSSAATEFLACLACSTASGIATR